MERLVLSTVKAGETITAVAGQEPEAYSYDFKVIEAGERPTCDLTQTGPDGATVGPSPVVLEGSGNWTTPEQNPVQANDPVWGRPRQELAMSIGWGMVRIGGFICIASADLSAPLERAYLQPECTDIRLSSE